MGSKINLTNTSGKRLEKKPRINHSNLIADGTNLFIGTESVTEPVGSRGIGGGGGYVETTYQELLDTKNNNQLSAATFYLITDYQTCYDQPDYDNFGAPIFENNYKVSEEIDPIIVFTTSNSTLSPDAYQPSYPKDKIKYDIEFNETEVTNSPAKGRITERIDEFNNRTDYDHRTILFKRYRGYSYNENNPIEGLIGISGITGTTGVLYGNTGTTFNSNISSGSIIAIPNLNPAFFEVISVESDSLAIISGVTISGTDSAPYYSASDDGIMSYYKPNIRQNQVYEYTTFGDAINDGGAVNNYIGNYSNLHLEFGTGDFILANNVLLEGSFRNNTIGNGSYNNTFNDDCDNNQIGDSFYNNSTNDDFDGNIIGENFNNNYITSNFNNNRIGSDFDFNVLLGGSFYRNNIGNDFNNNVWTNGDFQNNEIGNQFNDNNIYDDFYNNDIGNGYNGNESHIQFYRNLIGNGYNNNTVYSSFFENNIGHVFENNTIGTDLITYDFYGNIIGSGFEDNIITNNFYKNEIGSDFYNNEISGETYNNRIGEQFENNTIYGDFYDNQIFNEFKGNITYESFDQNRVDWGFAGNQISGFCTGNIFGTTISSNDFLGDVYANTFKGGVLENTIGNNFANNNIGFLFFSNIIGEDFGNGYNAPQGNTIGNNFIDNTIGEYFYNNTIADNFENNTIGNYFQFNRVETSLSSVNFTEYVGKINTVTYPPTSGTDGIYSGITGITSGLGINAVFEIEVSSDSVSVVNITNSGNNYQVGDTITISSTSFGSTEDLILTIDALNATPMVYGNYNKTIQKDFNGNNTLVAIANGNLYITEFITQPID